MLSTLNYPRSLNISLHLIISDFARRRQSLKSKCSQIREFVHELIQNIDRKVREKTTPRQFVKNKVRETLSDLGYVKITYWNTWITVRVELYALFYSYTGTNVYCMGSTYAQYLHSTYMQVIYMFLKKCYIINVLHNIHNTIYVGEKYHGMRVEQLVCRDIKQNHMK